MTTLDRDDRDRECPACGNETCVGCSSSATLPAAWCTEDHGYECCGCADHPVGKPWGWNSGAWDVHWSAYHPGGAA